MNILTVCLENGSRSPGAAHVLREMGYDAQSAALNKHAPTGRRRVNEALLAWANRIIVFYVESDQNDIIFKNRYPEFIHKTVFVHQPDTWGGPVREEHFIHFKKMFKEHPEYLD